jgi:hypothetical protein
MVIFANTFPTFSSFPLEAKEPEIEKGHFTTYPN